MIKIALLILSIRLLSVLCQTECSPNELTTDPVEAKCDAGDPADVVCNDCTLTIEDALLLNCGNAYVCENMVADVTATEDFLMECSRECSCCGATITIECLNDEYIKGVKCGGEDACAGATFEIIGCQFEKVECGNTDSCKDAEFIFTDIPDPDALIDEPFTCSGSFANACSGLICSETFCPVGSVAATTATPTTPAVTTATPVVTTATPVTPVVTTATPVTPVVTTATPVTPVVTTATPVTPVVTTATPVTPVVTTATPVTPVVTTATPTATTTPAVTVCVPNELTTDPVEAKCDDDTALCTDCSITLDDALLFNCGVESVCEGITADIIATEDFLMECTDDFACLGATINIVCENGETIKGVKCSGKSGCAGATITIEGCILEKVECADDDSCLGATFEFIDVTILEDAPFICSGGFEVSCSGLICTEDAGPAICPLESTGISPDGDNDGDDDLLVNARDGSGSQSLTAGEAASSVWAIVGYVGLAIIIVVVLAFFVIPRYKRHIPVSTEDRGFIDDDEGHDAVLPDDTELTEAAIPNETV